ncbi:MAG: hypothetical protein ACJAT7_003220 [Psychromonas sp.]|jgi:hypothetical protein|uniref:DUF4347 domain-containing protein n=1 Tax=Psychromonas sp. TaxID=1884585 RepID=UPI0039E445A9
MKKDESQNKHIHATVTFEELEPRMLLSADLPDIDLLVDDSYIESEISVDDILAELEAEINRIDAQLFQLDNDIIDDMEQIDNPGILLLSAEQPQNVRYELVIIDASVPDYLFLLDSLQSQAGENSIIDVQILDADRNGIEQLSEILAYRQDLDALHLITHGSSGEILIGNTQISQAELDQNADEISNWGNALSVDCYFLIYGCNLASTADGQRLANALGRLTGADVAAPVPEMTGLAINYTENDLAIDPSATVVDLDSVNFNDEFPG